MCMGIGFPFPIGFLTEITWEWEHKYAKKWEWEEYTWQWELNVNHHGNGSGHGNELKGMGGNEHVASHFLTSLIGVWKNAKFCITAVSNGSHVALSRHLRSFLSMVSYGYRVWRLCTWRHRTVTRTWWVCCWVDQLVYCASPTNMAVHRCICQPHMDTTTCHCCSLARAPTSTPTTRYTNTPDTAPCSAARHRTAPDSAWKRRHTAPCRTAPCRIRFERTVTLWGFIFDLGIRIRIPIGMCLSCNFVNVYTMCTRLHACITNTFTESESIFV